MEVKEFVAQTLKQVMAGLDEANAESTVEGQVLRFGTSGQTRFMKDSPGVFQDNNGHVYTSVEFDMAVTVTGEAEGGAKLKIPYFEGGGSGKKSSESISRVKFSIPCRLS